MVAAGIAIAVSGATGTGKTTLVNFYELHRLWLRWTQRQAAAGMWMP